MWMVQPNGTFSCGLLLLVHPKLLLFDEVRYLPLAINARYEKESNIFTTNQGFEKWGSVLGDEVMVTAMLDRILIRDHVVNIRGGSYRMSQYQAMYGFQQ